MSKLSGLITKTACCCPCLNNSESEESMEQNQKEGSDKPSSGKEERQGACGTTSDEKPGNGGKIDHFI